MALNNFDAKIVTRTKGKSSVFTAAYNHRKDYTDELTNETRYYSRLSGKVEWEGMFLPPNSPVWLTELAKSPESLWNAVEQREQQSTRKDNAQSARNWIIAIPHELSPIERSRLLTDFCREMARKGMVLDGCLHPPDLGSDSRNYHAHVEVTMREIGEDGFGAKVREWNNTEKGLNQWKERWSELGAKYLERAGFKTEAEQFRHGHKTLKVQKQEAEKRGDFEYAKECDRLPKKHEGRAIKEMEERGVKTEIRAHNDGVEFENWKNKLDLEFGVSPANLHSPGPNLRGDIEHIYWAMKNAKTPDAFLKDIDERGLHIARVTARDSHDTMVQNYLHGKNGVYVPILPEGDYVILNDKGHTFKLNERTTGKTRDQVKAFMKPVGAKDFPSFHDKWNELYEKRQAEKDFRPEDFGLTRKRVRAVTNRVAGMANSAERLAMMMFNLVEFIGAPILTPAQKLDGEIAEEKRREVARRSLDNSRERD